MNILELCQIKLAGVNSVLHGLTRGKITMYEAMSHILECIQDIDDVNDWLKQENASRSTPKGESDALPEDK